MPTTNHYDLDIDTTLGGNNASDYIIPSQKAIKDYVDNHSGGSAPVWGNITGTLSDQTDLQNALNSKQATINSSNKLDYAYISNTPTVDQTYNGTSANAQSGVAIEAEMNVRKTDYYGTSSTSAGTQTKTVTCTGFTLKTGVSIRVKFTNAQSYNGQPQLNVNSTGAKNITLRGTTAGIRYMWNAGEVVDFTYDGTSWIWERGGIATTTYYGVTKLSSSLTSTSTAVAATPSTINGAMQNIVTGYPVYSATATYEVGDRARYSSYVWECTTAITEAEAWDETHWAKVDTLQTQINNKQDTLVSGTNIKTINNNSILGSGNLTLDGLPTQTGQSGKFLTTDGTDASWATVTIPSIDIDNKSITENSNDELQTVAVIDQNNTTTAIKTWTGTRQQYDAITTKDANTLYNITDDTDVTLSLLELLYPVGAIYIGTCNACPLQTLGIGQWQLVSSGRVLQGISEGQDAGDIVQAGLPNITGATGQSDCSAYTYNPYNTGAFYTGGESTKYFMGRSGETSNTYGLLHIDASRSSPVYGNSSTVQPPAYLVNIWERIS